MDIKTGREKAKRGVARVLSKLVMAGLRSAGHNLKVYGLVVKRGASNPKTFIAPCIVRKALGELIYRLFFSKSIMIFLSPLFDLTCPYVRVYLYLLSSSLTRAVTQ
ncbi:hypothetical protein E2C01_066971 [Portunus trituberculatus]|uniref:Uncharacterized protein n=1 Tax=Portunus trituberculatus TaxID=210409 RepID=A0A5B7HSD3_PORTR|nr:hypothetical protein [Portunus trituberculatus]